MFFVPRRAGQSLPEYALILALVALAAVVILLLLGDGIASAYSNIVMSI